MNIKKFFIAIILASLVTSLLSANSLMKVSLQAHNPYLADLDGFDSLFINPAGMANKTTAFDLYITAGAWGDDFKNIEMLKSLSSTYEALINPDKTVSADSFTEFMPVVSDVISQDTLDIMFGGTSLEGITLEESTDIDTWANWKDSNSIQKDMNKVKDNALDPDNQQKIIDNFGDISFNLETAVRLGTLIKGVGLGIYTNVYTLLSLTAMGFADLVVELGTVLGYGFSIGKFTFGVRGQYAMFFSKNPEEALNIFQGNYLDLNLLHGYTWGIDVGTIWEVKKGLRFGLVLNDLISSKIKIDKLLPITIGKIINVDLMSPTDNIELGIDASFGMTWEQTRGDFRPGLSVDFFNLISFIKALNDDVSAINQLYQKDTFLLSKHLRVGLNFNIVELFDFRTCYYMDRIGFEFGFNTRFLEAYIALNTLYNFSDFGGSLMIQFKI